ncbi:MAG: hypothetical protein H0X42_09715 [Solirubrobacterales bacterium]|nr:hypothetical protein [Solirubrobacterales bacterium]
MAEPERDSTQDWVLPKADRPATVVELERRIDVALAVARASEAAAVEIGAAALDAAQQAHRAAELAERASAAVAGGGGEVATTRNGPEDANGTAGRDGDELLDGAAAEREIEEDVLLHRFSERADRVLARLRAIERLPQSTG